MIAPGAKLDGYEVLSVDPTGKRVCVGCPCGAVHVVGTDALLSGSVLCSAFPWTPQQIAQRRDEADQQQRQRDLRNWRPQA